jgi:hypothetical protein
MKGHIHGRKEERRRREDPTDHYLPRYPIEEPTQPNHHPSKWLAHSLTKTNNPIIQIPTIPSSIPIPIPPYTHVVTNNLHTKKGFTITTGSSLLKTYSSPSTDSGTPLTRNFCGDCGSSLFAFTDLYPDIIGLAAATLDGGFEEWRPGVEQ